MDDQGFATDMWSLDIPRKTCVVSLLLFATSIGHVTFSGEAKSHIKNLLYSPPVTGVGISGVEEQCNHFIDRPAAASNISLCYCEHAGLYGRLGNRINSVSHMIGEAESKACGVHLPHDMLSGWDPPLESWAHIRTNHNVSDTNNICGSRNAEEWFFGGFPAPKCHLHLLRKYFNLNQTHALGKACSSTDHVALHVRSGDVARGVWGEDGSYKPSTDILSNYGLFPTAYFISVISEIRGRRGNSVTFYVFCETMDNPTSEYFEKLSVLDLNVVMRVGQTLIDDMRLMLCAKETAASFGTFRLVFDLSTQSQIRHDFSHNPMMPSCSTVWHWISSSQQAAKFTDVTKEWKNTGLQRHEVNAAYEMNHTEVLC